MREKGIVSDYSRNPGDPNYQFYSSALYLAGQEWRAGQYAEAEQKIQTLRLELAGSG
jgi:hypothetical protein